MPTLVRTARTGFVRLAAMLASLVAAPSSRADFYSITDIGVAPGYSTSSGAAINDGGVICGTLGAGFSTHAMIGGAGGVNPIRTPAFWGDTRAYALSGSGIVVGSADVWINGRASTRAFKAAGQGMAQDLGLTITMPSTGRNLTARSTIATGVSGSGTVVGIASFGPGADRAFVSDPSGVLYDLGTLRGGTSSRANGINDGGQVVGTATDDRGMFRAFYTRDSGPGAEMIALESLPFGSQSFGMGINASGRVVGYADSHGSFRAVRSVLGTNTLEDLGTLPGGGATFGLAINQAGDVVGSASLAGGASRAIFYSDSIGSFIDLNQRLIDPSSSWVLTSATGINDQGQIVGTGLFHGEARAFLLTPVTVPEPSAAALAAIGGLALAALRCARRRAA